MWDMRLDNRDLVLVQENETEKCYTRISILGHVVVVDLPLNKQKIHPKGWILLFIDAS